MGRNTAFLRSKGAYDDQNVFHINWLSRISSINSGACFPLPPTEDLRQQRSTGGWHMKRIAQRVISVQIAGDSVHGHEFFHLNCGQSSKFICIYIYAYVGKWLLGAFVLLPPTWGDDPVEQHVCNRLKPANRQVYLFIHISNIFICLFFSFQFACI